MAVEILAPANTRSMVRRVFDAGADCAYAGLRGFCRWEKDGIDAGGLEGLLEERDRAKKKLYGALNRVPLSEGMGGLFETLERAVAMGIDGVILNDAGVIAEARRRFPGLYLTASIGVAPLNVEEVLFLADAGADTVILSERLAVEEIAAIRRRAGAGLELFACGVLEFTYTGKCCLGSYARQRKEAGRMVGSAKRGGACSAPCGGSFRFEGEGAGGRISLAREPFVMMDRLPEILPYLRTVKVWPGGLDEDRVVEAVKAVSAVVRGPRP